MDKLITKVADLINKKQKSIITISETSHWSYTSHTFHYKLLKTLHKQGFTCFSSERLGILDAFLMNKWLDGKINCSLDYLYSDVLPFGGIGTYRWMVYFKKTNKKYYLVGCEMDILDSLSEKHKNTLTKILNQLISQKVDITKKINWIPKTKEDKIIKYAINSFYEKGWDNRYIFWQKNMEKEINKHKNFFINGFHLTKGPDGLGKELIKKYKNKVFIFGMDSLNIYHPVVFINSKWLKQHNLKKSEIWSDIFWKKFSDWYSSYPYDIWIKKIDNIHKYIEVNPYIKKYNGYFLIKADKIKASFSHLGASPMPVVNNNKLSYYIDNNNKIGKYYDYMIYIPISRFNKIMNR